MPKRKLENRTIDVIVLEPSKDLGERYEIIKVRPIFARNVLFPKKMAIIADANNIHNFAKKMEAAKVAREKKAQNLDDLFMKIQSDEGIKIMRKTNKDNTLYAKVDEKDIADMINQVYGIEVESHLFKLKKKLSQIGIFNVPFIYKDMKKEVIVKIEAEIELKGEEKRKEQEEEKRLADEEKKKKQEKKGIKKEKTPTYVRGSKKGL